MDLSRLKYYGEVVRRSESNPFNADLSADRRVALMTMYSALGVGALYALVFPVFV